MQPLWIPSGETVASSNITKFTDWLHSKYQLRFGNYHELWKWSTDNTDLFWSSLISYFNVQYSGTWTAATNGAAMPDTRWFEGIKLSYAEHIFRAATTNTPAIIFRNESGIRLELSWTELRQQVAALRQSLQRLGVGPGDRVAAFVSCTIEATVGLLATNSLGAVWSSCSPDFGLPAVIERFAQIEPHVLIATDHYHYGGRAFDTSVIVGGIAAALPTAASIVLISEKEQLPHLNKETLRWSDLIADQNATLEFTRIPFNDPVWILYSSGTTGAPKAIVHSAGGILLEQLKYGSFHNDFHPGERCTWYTTTGWMMWNYIHGCLLHGCTLVLYDGNPAWPGLDILWRMAGEEQISHFGTSASFIVANQKRDITPSEITDLSALRSIGSTGSTLPVEGFEWVYAHVKKDLWLASMSGGTDICSAFVGGNPTLPVYAGEIQCRALGCRIEAFDDEGRSLNDGLGEMVITQPIPSMPVAFWKDRHKLRYRDSYFSTFPGVWRHGDWISITAHDGVIIYGRSDATLNRGGIRIGTSEIYCALDKVQAIADSVIVCIEKPGGLFWMPLFVVLKAGEELTVDSKAEINRVLKTQYTPRHVPDDIIQVPDIPYTISGKKSEMPVKKILMGVDPSTTVNRDVLRNPASLDFFIELAHSMKSH